MGMFTNLSIERKIDKNIYKILILKKLHEKGTLNSNFNFFSIFYLEL